LTGRPCFLVRRLVQVGNAPSADAPPAEHATRAPRLVPAAVTEAKFAQQLRRWHANADTYARRGWVLLGTGDLTVEVGFLQNVAMGGRSIPVMTACIRLEYWNFDLWPPSLTFLDPVTRQPAPPPVRAPDRVSATEVRDALIDQHPETLQPFLCLPGIREYHTHPQHSGDDWLLHRHLREGDLAVICDRVWRRMSRNVLGMSFAIQSLAPLGTQLEMSLLQGDADLAQRQLAQAAAQQRPPPEGPPAAGPATSDSPAEDQMQGLATPAAGVPADATPDSLSSLQTPATQGSPDGGLGAHIPSPADSGKAPDAWT
jgi:Predicted metal binding domain